MMYRLSKWEERGKVRTNSERKYEIGEMEIERDKGFTWLPPSGECEFNMTRDRNEVWFYDWVPAVSGITNVPIPTIPMESTGENIRSQQNIDFGTLFDV